MGYKLIISDNSEVDIDLLLENYITLYSESEESFYKDFSKLHKDIKQEINSLSKNKESYLDTQLEDTSDLAYEVLGYYNSYKKIAKKVKAEKSTAFTLRNSDDLAIFEEFLDKMIKLKSLSPKHFVNLFPKCPVVLWDKIDDLRETSNKPDRDSEEYTRCLVKCKLLSFEYSELSGTNTSNYE